MHVGPSFDAHRNQEDACRNQEKNHQEILLNDYCQATQGIVELTKDELAGKLRFP
jgi:hypothetical protein